jgi:signal peptidase I
MDKATLKKEIIDWVKCIVIAVGFSLLLVNFVIQPTEVFSVSMEPTMYEHDRVILEKISQKADWLSRGEIIAFDSPTDDRVLIKRIIGLEGDRVEIKNDKVYVNGIELHESYIKDGKTNGDINVVVPEGKLFVMGDNRLNSYDSRNFGSIDLDSVKGRALVRFYPFNEIGTLNQKDPTK